MKQHTPQFKKEIKELGRQLDSKITYILNGSQVVLGGEMLNSVSPKFQSDILKSVMKEIEIDSNIDIEIGTEINYQFGLLVDDNYEYIDYGKYIVYSSEKQEDTNSYRIIAYDKMLNSMVDYKGVKNGTFPMSVRSYITSICNDLNISFENIMDEFANYDKMIPSDIYKDLGYTYRDILDELAQVTASTICINDNNKLEVRYIKDIEETNKATGKNIIIEDAIEKELLSLNIEGNSVYKVFLPEGYTQVEYVKSNSYTHNTNYIDTEIKPTNNTSLEIKVIGSYNSYDRWFGSSNNFKLELSSSGESRLYWNNTSIKTPVITNQIIKLKLDKNKLYINDVLNNTFTNGTFTDTVNLRLFGSTDGDRDGILKIYYAKIWENDVLVRDYVPCYRNSDNVIGLYDLVGNRFYTNGGSTAFSKGNNSPTPDSPQEIESVKGITNLFDYGDSQSGTKNGVTYSYDSNTKEWTLNGTATGQFDISFINAPTISFKTNTNYVMTQFYVDGTITNGSITTYSQDSTQSWKGIEGRLTSTINVVSNYLFNVNLTLQSSKIIRIANGTKLNNFKFKTQIEEGTISHNFVPYGTWLLQKTIGKNLFNKNGNITNRKYLSLNGVELSSDVWGISDYIEVIPNKIYTLSNLYGNAITGCFYDKDKKFISNIGNYNGQTIKTFTSPTNATYFRFSVIILSTQPGYNLETVMLEENATATEYEPYQEHTALIDMNKYDEEGNITGHHELCSIGDTRDNWLDGTITKKIEKVVLNGSETVSVNKDKQNVFQFLVNALPKQPVLDTSELIASNYFVYKQGDPTDSTNEDYIWRYDNKVVVDIRKSIVKSANDFKAWLKAKYDAGNPVIIYYILNEEETYETPYEKITLLDGYNRYSIVNDIETNLEIEYVNGYETIDEEYLKDINVNFGEKYGKINSIVLSRSADSDNVYIQDTASVAVNGLCELKISDNQIMNFNDRSDYLPAILKQLNGLEYYINDFTSPGICYLDICDGYRVKIGENLYKCVMFNDEVNVTQGLEEIVYTDMPEKSETDYKKADKTDQKLNKTYLIVDKQNQKIEAVIESVDEQDLKISKITQTVDEINSKISDISDITVTGETVYASVDMDNINESQPIMVKIHPVVENISYLYPSSSLYPSSTLYPKTITLRFHNKKTNENFDYTLPTDLLYFDADNYDDFSLDYDSQTVFVNKKCKYNASGQVEKLSTPTTLTYNYPDIQLTDGNYTVSLVGYKNAYLFVRLMASNIYTAQFATKVELETSITQTSEKIESSVSAKYATKSDLSNAETQLNSTITQTANGINTTVSKKVGKDEVVTTINQSAEQITLKGNRLVVQADNFQLDKNGNMICTNAKVTGEINSTSGNIGGWIINNNGLTNNIVKLNSDGSSTIYTVADLIIIRGYIMGTTGFDLPSQMIAHYDINKDGIVDAVDYVLLQQLIGIRMN